MSCLSSTYLVTIHSFISSHSFKFIQGKTHREQPLALPAGTKRKGKKNNNHSLITLGLGIYNDTYLSIDTTTTTPSFSCAVLPFFIYLFSFPSRPLRPLQAVVAAAPSSSSITIYWMIQKTLRAFLKSSPTIRTAFHYFTPKQPPRNVNPLSHSYKHDGGVVERSIIFLPHSALFRFEAA